MDSNFQKKSFLFFIFLQFFFFFNKKEKEKTKSNPLPISGIGVVSQPRKVRRWSHHPKTPRVELEDLEGMGLPPLRWRFIFLFLQI
jgi:hypothetical protein